MKTLTVAVPSYNVQSTLEGTIRSMLACKEKEQLEILIINDGSTDNTEALAKELERENPDIVKVISKENGGHGSAVNTGALAATGKYYKVVDGDDWLDPAGLDAFLTFAQQTQADLIINPYWTVNDKTGERILEKHLPEDVVYNKVVDFEEVKVQKTFDLHTFTIRTQLLQDHFRPCDEHCFYVDVEFVLYPIPYVQTVAFLEESLYLYRIFSDGQSVNMKNMRRNIDQHLRVLKSIIVFYSQEKEGLSPIRKDYILSRILWLFRMQYRIFYSFPYGKETAERIQSFNDTYLQMDPDVKKAVVNSSLRSLTGNGYWINWPLLKVRKWMMG